MREIFDEIGWRILGHLRFRTWLLSICNDAIDTAQAVVLIELPGKRLVLEVRRQIDLVLQDAAVQIDNVERAVGRRVEVDVAEALVSGGKKILFIVRAFPG